MSYAIIPTLMKRITQLTADARSDIHRCLERATEVDKLKAQIDFHVKRRRAELRRADQFDPYDGYDFQCPRCWIVDGVRAKIRPVSSEKVRLDALRCQKCGDCFQFMDEIAPR